MHSVCIHVACHFTLHYVMYLSRALIHVTCHLSLHAAPFSLYDMLYGVHFGLHCAPFDICSCILCHFDVTVTLRRMSLAFLSPIVRRMPLVIAQHVTWPFTLACCQLSVMCHVSCAMCHVPCVMCHVSYVMCLVKFAHAAGAVAVCVLSNVVCHLQHMSPVTCHCMA